MPNACNLATFCFVIYPVYKPIRSINDLANIVIPVFGDYATVFWKFLQPFCLGNQFVSERHCTVRIVACDKDDYIVKVVASSGRPINL